MGTTSVVLILEPSTKKGGSMKKRMRMSYVMVYEGIRRVVNVEVKTIDQFVKEANKVALDCEYPEATHNFYLERYMDGVWIPEYLPDSIIDRIL